MVTRVGTAEALTAILIEKSGAALLLGQGALVAEGALDVNLAVTIASGSIENTRGATELVRSARLGVERGGAGLTKESDPVGVVAAARAGGGIKGSVGAVRGSDRAFVAIVAAPETFALAIARINGGATVLAGDVADARIAVPGDHIVGRASALAGLADHIARVTNYITISYTT